jgi:hypothetical protein
MQPIHLAGEMAVWSEEKWAAFEGNLQRQLRNERRRLSRLAVQRDRTTMLKESAAWSLVAVTLLLVILL